MSEEISLQMRIAVIMVITASFIWVAISVFVMLNQMLVNYTLRFDQASNTGSGNLIELSKYSQGVDGAICYSNIMDAIGTIDCVIINVDAGTTFLGDIEDIRTSQLITEGYPHYQVESDLVEDYVNGVPRFYKRYTIYSFRAEGESLNVLFTKFSTNKFRVFIEPTKTQPLIKVELKEIKHD